MRETWKSVYEGIYEVSDLGRVRRRSPGINTRPGRLLTPYRHRNAYALVTLHVKGIQITAAVHILVALAFKGERPSGYDIDHIDGDKGNNAARNLEYVTRSENLRRSYRLGLSCTRKGSASCLSKLTERDVLAIRSLYASGGVSTYELGKRFNVTQPNIVAIIHRRSWAHLP